MCLWWLILVPLMFVLPEFLPWGKEHPFAYLTGLITFISVFVPFSLLVLWPKRDAYGDLDDPNFSLREAVKMVGFGR